jgi:hypothetical protein
MKKAQSYVFYIGASSVFVYCTTFIFYRQATEVELLLIIFSLTL